MEKSLEFNSQICTTREQSERLLALGLKKESADMMYITDKNVPDEYRLYRLIPEYYEQIPEYLTHIPAWSLHRLLEMLYQDIGECMIFFPNTYDEFIADIENCIRRGNFNKDYLEDKK